MEQNEELEFGPDILTLEDEEGNEHNFEVLDEYDEGQGRYLAMIPVVDEENLSDDNGELVILKVESEDEEDEYLAPIEDEEEFDRISKIFMERLDEYYDFVE